MTNTIQNSLLKIGIIQEGKNPPDSRTPLPPNLCQQALQLYPNQLKIVVQPSPHRCFTDQEYTQHGIPLQTDLSDCDILLGVKEVPTNLLIPNKKYLFFSHTIKAQPYNRQLLKTILQKNIQLIDYECLKHPNGSRILGFGHFAGIVGAHNGLLDYGKKTNTFTLPPAHTCHNFEEIKQIYTQITLPANLRIVVTGGGRVAKGAIEVLQTLNIKELTPEQFLQNPNTTKPVFTVLQNQHLFKHLNTHTYQKNDFYQNPQNYYSTFEPYTQTANLLLNGIYWHAKIPALFTNAAIQHPLFTLKVIADITCDINGSIPATIRSTHIGDSTFGFDKQTLQETPPYLPHTLDIMAIDNLPNELPRDAATEFGTLLLNHIIPELLNPQSSIIEQATIAKNGTLTPLFSYLQLYANEL